MYRLTSVSQTCRDINKTLRYPGLRNIRGFNIFELAFQFLFLEPLIFTCVLVAAYTEFYYNNKYSTSMKQFLFVLFFFKKQISILVKTITKRNYKINISLKIRLRIDILLAFDCLQLLIGCNLPCISKLFLISKAYQIRYKIKTYKFTTAIPG